MALSLNITRILVVARCLVYLKNRPQISANLWAAAQKYLKNVRQENGNHLEKCVSCNLGGPRTELGGLPENPSFSPSSHGWVYQNFGYKMFNQE